MKKNVLFVIGFILFNINNIAQTSNLFNIKSEQIQNHDTFSTNSKSSERIRVYFNHWCDNSASPIADAVWTEYFEDSLVSYINSAETTLDVCTYSTSSLPIVAAINNAEMRGVTVRYIAAANTGTNNTELDNLSISIPFIQRPEDGEVMHNKFLIIDVADSEKATIITGSTNHSYNSCHDDYNNMVIIQDQALAMAYRTEFEEMWGSDSNTPNPSNAKFGADKSDNTPHIFDIDGVLIELYFSPSDGTTSHIANAISSANSDMNFAMLTFINNDLGDAVINIHNAGVNVKGIIENILYFGSEYNSLLNAGVDVLSHFTTPNFFHHKYAVIDATNPSSNPCVITGSHNWTNSAEEDYDENTLIIYDAEIAGMYLEEFKARYADLTTSSLVENSADNFSIFPNPASNFIKWNNTISPVSVEIYNLSGNCVFYCHKPSSNKISTQNIANGLYFFVLRTETETMRGKIHISR